MDDSHASIVVVYRKQAVAQHLISEESFGDLLADSYGHFDSLVEPIDLNKINRSRESLTRGSKKTLESFKGIGEVIREASRHDQPTGKPSVNQDFYLSKSQIELNCWFTRCIEVAVELHYCRGDIIR